MMNIEAPGISRNIFKNKKAIRWIAVGLVAILLAAAVFTFLSMRNKKGTPSSQQNTAVVAKGNLSVTITGSAPVESADRWVLSPKVTSKVTKVYFKEGDQVKAGDLLYELDDTDAQLNVEATRNSIAQTQLTQTNNLKSVSGLNVTAPFAGQVNNITVKAGDTIGKGSPILTLVDLSKLKVTLPFSGAGVKSVKVGSKATVNLQDLMQSIGGTVTYVSSRPYATASGGEVYNVDITVDNPGSLRDGITANAEIATLSGTLTSVDSAPLSFINTEVLRSDAGGTVKSINVQDKQYVNQGELMIVLENDDLKLTSDTNDLKLQNLQRQLEIQQEQLTYYKITAPVTGTITTQSIKEGDTVKPGDTLGVVADMTHMQFTVDIDELDIAKVAVGQKVNITLDALPETSQTPLTGAVSKTAMEGSSSNGVTTYPVTISIDKSDKLKAGMYANGEIFISQKENVLMVPIEAVQKMGNRSFVMVMGGGQNNGRGKQASGGQKSNDSQGNGNGKIIVRRNSAASNPYYANAVMTPVETGISNDTYIEIVSGLQEGQTILLPQTASSSGQNAAQQKGGAIGFMGGMGGGNIRIQQGQGQGQQRNNQQQRGD